MKPIHYLLIASTLLYVYMAAIVMPGASARLAAASTYADCAKPLDLFIIGFNQVEVGASFVCMGAEGLKVYRDIETSTDVIYPISYALFFFLAVFIWANYCTNKKGLATILASLSIVAMLFDYAENASVVALIDGYPTSILDGKAVGQASLFNQLKWIFAFAGIGLTLVFGIWALVKRLTQKPISA